MKFIAIAAGSSSIAIVGLGSDGKAHMFVSSEGKVWSERELSWLENGSPVYLQAEPQQLIYDHEHDQFILKCGDGTAMILPPCSHCNQRVDNSIIDVIFGKE